MSFQTVDEKVQIKNHIWERELYAVNAKQKI